MFWKKVLVNVACNSLVFSTSSTDSKIESCRRGERYLRFEDTFDYGAPEAKRLKEKLPIYPAANG